MAISYQSQMNLRKTFQSVCLYCFSDENTYVLSLLPGVLNVLEYLFADEQRIPNLDVDARIIGLRYESGRGTPNYTDGADGAYALYTAYTQSRTYDFHGNCFALSNFTENKTYTASILQASCDFQLGIDRVTCKSRAENVDMSAEITFKRVFHLEDEIRKYFGEDSVNFEHFLLFKSVYCRIQTAVNQT